MYLANGRNTLLFADLTGKPVIDLTMPWDGSLRAIHRFVKIVWRPPSLARAHPCLASGPAVRTVSPGRGSRMNRKRHEFDQVRFTTVCLFDRDGQRPAFFEE